MPLSDLVDTTSWLKCTFSKPTFPVPCVWRSKLSFEIVALITLSKISTLEEFSLRLFNVSEWEVSHCLLKLPTLDVWLTLGLRLLVTSDLKSIVSCAKESPSVILPPYVNWYGVSRCQYTFNPFIILTIPVPLGFNSILALLL